MSTLGGSRGERNAKPKFTALDINRMYKNSRVSSEPLDLDLDLHLDLDRSKPI